MVDFRDTSQRNEGGQDLTTPQIQPVSENRDHSNSVDALSLNPETRAQFASASHDKTIKIWDANTQQCVKTMHGHEDGIWSLNYLTDGRRLISAGVDGQILMWDSQSGQASASLKFHDRKCFKAVVSDDMRMAASVSADRKIAVWDLRNPVQPMLVNDQSEHIVSACDFSVDQKAVITGNFAGRINVLDLETKQMRVDYDIMVLQPENEEEIICYDVRSVKNHPQGGNIFVLSSGIGIPNVISYEGWHDEPLHRLETIAKFHGHKAPIRSCNFSPDLSKMVSCCSDHSLRVWDNQSMQAQKILQGHSDVVTSAIFLNENTIVSGSWDCKIMLWNIGQ